MYTRIKNIKTIIMIYKIKSETKSISTFNLLYITALGFIIIIIFYFKFKR